MLFDLGATCGDAGCIGIVPRRPYQCFGKPTSCSSCCCAGGGQTLKLSVGNLFRPATLSSGTAAAGQGVAGQAAEASPWTSEGHAGVLGQAAPAAVGQLGTSASGSAATFGAEIDSRSSIGAGGGHAGQSPAAGAAGHVEDASELVSANSCAEAIGTLWTSMGTVVSSSCPGGGTDELKLASTGVRAVSAGGSAASAFRGVATSRTVSSAGGRGLNLVSARGSAVPALMTPLAVSSELSLVVSPAATTPLVVTAAAGSAAPSEVGECGLLSSLLEGIGSGGGSLNSELVPPSSVAAGALLTAPPVPLL